jgi:glutamyl-tRNA synthetase
LFNWLFARRTGGLYLLRIEDTDRTRSSNEMTAAILDGLSWLGLDWDEGPYHQADGLERHRCDAIRLLETRAAYRCFCTPRQLEERRKAAGADPSAFRYDRQCLKLDPSDAERRAASGEPHTIRFRVPEGTTAWDDAVHGVIEFANAEIEDFIVLRTDGTPIYNLAVVSDDVEMRITHVIRGDDHIPNTPKQILLYRALGRSLPTFAHVPMILGPDGKRLSKRHGATALGEYRSQGILPQAMMNFLALLGWSPGTDVDVLTVDGLVAQFSLEGINKKSAIFDVRKLFWLNGQHLSRTEAVTLAPLLAPRFEAAGLMTQSELVLRRNWFHALIDLLKVRARSLDDIVARAGAYLAESVSYEQEAVEKYWKEAPVVARLLEGLRGRWSALAAWETAALEAALRQLAGELGVAAGQLIHPLRVAITGAAVSPGIFEVAAVLGRERVLARMDAAIARLRAP